MNGNVSIRCHPQHPYLHILNYTHKAAHETRLIEDNGGVFVSGPIWGDGTIDYCRGLIFNALTEEIIARPFRKFHNLNTPSIPETMEGNLPLIEPTITEKYDGSLGIFYNTGAVGIATRGSFDSDQAKWATAWLAKRDTLCYPQNHTLLFEIIYPENRIVVDYGKYEGLILLAIVNNETGEELSHHDMRDIANQNHLNYTPSFAPEVVKLHANRPNFEGFVISYPQPGRDPIKVKVKLDEYVRLHRIITGLNPRSVWECLRDDSPLPSGDLPTNFVEWLESWEKKLNSEYNSIREEAYRAFSYRPLHLLVTDDKTYRKMFAEYAMSPENERVRSLLFAMLDKKDIAPLIWKMIEPAGNDKSFKVDHDE